MRLVAIVVVSAVALEGQASVQSTDTVLESFSLSDTKVLVKVCSMPKWSELHNVTTKFCAGYTFGTIRS